MLFRSLGFEINTIQVPIFQIIDLGPWSWPITILWIVGVINSINLIGDLNGDYIVNILDILIMVNIIMGSIDDPGNADINDDNLINILDIVSLVNVILED